MMKTYPYYKEKLQGLSFPYACVDMELLRQNCQQNLDRAKDKKVRIASKSIRCTEVMRELLAYDPQFEGVMTYHGEETLFLLQAGFDNLLLGYPVVDPGLLERMAKAVANGAYICFMADLEVHLDLLNEAGKKHQIQLPVCLDIDMSSDYGPLHFGVWRSRIGNIQCLEAVLKHLSGLDYLRLDGIMGYEAQVAGLGDKLKGQALKNSVVQWLKQKSVKKARRLRQEAVDLIASMGFDLRFVNGGGTGSAETTTLESAVTEITIGSGFYTPHLFDYYQAFSLSPALFYGIQVVRQPKDGMYTCHGGGFTASGGVAPIKAPVVYLPQGGKLLSTEGAGEVQTPIVFDKTTNLQIGDPVFLRHAKAGELCEHFNHLYLLDGDQLRTVPTYRGEGQAFG